MLRKNSLFLGWHAKEATDFKPFFEDSFFHFLKVASDLIFFFRRFGRIDSLSVFFSVSQHNTMLMCVIRGQKKNFKDINIKQRGRQSFFLSTNIELFCSRDLYFFKENLPTSFLTLIIVRLLTDELNLHGYVLSSATYKNKFVSFSRLFQVAIPLDTNCGQRLILNSTWTNLTVNELSLSYKICVRQKKSWPARRHKKRRR